MKNYFCFEPDHKSDGMDIEHYWPDAAAAEYAEKADENSGGEYKETFKVHVRDPEGVDHIFDVEPYYEKIFHAWSV